MAAHVDAGAARRLGVAAGGVEPRRTADDLRRHAGNLRDRFRTVALVGNECRPIVSGKLFESRHYASYGSVIEPPDLRVKFLPDFLKRQFCRCLRVAERFIF